MKNQNKHKMCSMTSFINVYTLDINYDMIEFEEHSYTFSYFQLILQFYNLKISYIKK